MLDTQNSLVFVGCKIFFVIFFLAKEESVPRSDSADELASEEKSPNQSKPSLATLPQSSSFVLQPPLPALNPPKKPGINLSNTESQTAIPIILAPIPPLGNELKGLSKENISVKRETAERPDSLPLSLSSTELTGGVPEDVSDSDDRSPMLDNDSNRSPSPMDSSRKMPQGPNNVYDI